MNQNSQNPFSAWMDMNKNMLETWNNWVYPANAKTDASDSGKGTGAENPMKAFYDYYTKGFAQNPMYSWMTGDGNNMMEQMNRQWQENMTNMAAFIPNQAVKDTFNRFISSYQAFNGLQSYWDMFLKNMPSDITDWNSFAKPIMSYYENLTNTFFQPFLPGQLSSFFVAPMENIQAMQQSFMQFFKPWMDDSAVLQGHLIKALQGDKDAYLEFLKAWSEVYKNSYSKALKMPMMGASHEQTEKVLKLLDYYVNYVVSLNEYFVLITQSMSGTMEKLLQNMMELQKEEKHPKTFMEFFKLWSSVNEQAFQELFVTEAFEKIMNETVSAGSKFKVLFDDFLQDALSFLPFPSRREIDSVEKEIYELRKKVKAQEKEIKQLKEKIEPVKA